MISYAKWHQIISRLETLKMLDQLVYCSQFSFYPFDRWIDIGFYQQCKDGHREQKNNHRIASPTIVDWKGGSRQRIRSAKCSNQRIVRGGFILISILICCIRLIYLFICETHFLTFMHQTACILLHLTRYHLTTSREGEKSNLENEIREVKKSIAESAQLGQLDGHQILEIQARNDSMIHQHFKIIISVGWETKRKFDLIVETKSRDAMSARERLEAWHSDGNLLNTCIFVIFYRASFTDTCCSHHSLLARNISFHSIHWKKSLYIFQIDIH